MNLPFGLRCRRRTPGGQADLPPGGPPALNQHAIMTKPTFAVCGKNDLILVAGAGGFIGGSLVRYFTERGFTRIRAVDRKPLPEWYQRIDGVESLCLDLTDEASCKRAVAGAAEVYNLAADMGGMGFIERFRIMCLRSILINTHLIEAAYRAGVERYFYSSSACAYNTQLQADPHCRALKESDAYPAFAERGYGWEKLMSEMFCQEYHAERGMRTAIARFHNVYGPWGTWDGGREKAPAALCRKVIVAKDTGADTIEIWGDGSQQRSYMYIDDCLVGIDQIMHCNELIATPINLGSSEMISVDELVSLVEKIGGVRLKRKYLLGAPKGVAGRNSDNTMIKRILRWEPSISVSRGLRPTYRWIEQQYRARQAGRKTVKDTL
ncbi:MAG TPA: NAD-dependent epimerase/dehydratase family protein [Opitutaceae bacterium]|nr:NAD-dependent epimerase/dehydratase family protein [Opitutaceae bacterium]